MIINSSGGSKRIDMMVVEKIEMCHAANGQILTIWRTDA
jgi:hypothetical protein